MAAALASSCLGSQPCESAVELLTLREHGDCIALLLFRDLVQRGSSRGEGITTQLLSVAWLFSVPAAISEGLWESVFTF